MALKMLWKMEQRLILTIGGHRKEPLQSYGFDSVSGKNEQRLFLTVKGYR